MHSQPECWSQPEGGGGRRTAPGAREQARSLRWQAKAAAAPRTVPQRQAKARAGAKRQWRAAVRRCPESARRSRAARRPWTATTRHPGRGTTSRGRLHEVHNQKTSGEDDNGYGKNGDQINGRASPPDTGPTDKRPNPAPKTQPFAFENATGGSGALRGGLCPALGGVLAKARWRAVRVGPQG